MGTYWALKGHIAQSQGDHLDLHSDEKVLVVIMWGRLVLLTRGQEESLLDKLRDHQARVYSDQMVLIMARRKAGLS